MTRRPFKFRAHAIFGLLAVLTVLGPGLTACAPDDSPIARALGLVSGRAALSAEANKELNRFYAVYDEYVSDPTDTRHLKHFRDAFERVRRDYVHEVPDAQLVDSAIKGVMEMDPKPTPKGVEPEALVEAALDAMTGDLDPHSGYLNPREYNEMRISNRGEFGGLGIQVTMDKEAKAVKVVAPIEGTPADRAGMRTDDLIVQIDGDPVAGLDLTQAVNRMRGRPGTRIVLTVRRGADPLFDVPIVRDVIRVKSVWWRAEGDVGYIRVAAFNEKVDDGLTDAIEALSQDPGPRLRGIVLDLRRNPGGLLEMSVDLADAFLDQGTIVSVRGRGQGRGESRTGGKPFDAQYGAFARDLPMVVLINRGSASASEIVASALQDHGRAVIMGQRSFGKGSVQTISPLPVEGALRLTTALYYAPSGRAIQSVGVTPDILLKPKEEPAQAKAAGEGGEDEAAAAPRREADLPGALSSAEARSTQAQAEVDEESCPDAGPEGKDKALGCALAYIRAGSLRGFVGTVTGAHLVR